MLIVLIVLIVVFSHDGWSGDEDIDGVIVIVFARCEEILLQRDPVNKANQSIALCREWLAMSEEACRAAVPTGTNDASMDDEILAMEVPGRPDQPMLIDPKDLPRRGLGSLRGRVALLHSLAHIEFNAINLALDAVYRFRAMPLEYISDWLRVASDEGQHFMLLHERLAVLGSHYGAMSAHDGLWDMARRTAHDVLVRMALVPRILEARGLDVAPPMIEKLKQHDDADSAAILERIYTDEITHVEVGNRWFRHICSERDLDGVTVFRDLLRGPNSAYLRSPFNDVARLEAGFSVEELELIRQMEDEYRKGI